MGKMNLLKANWYGKVGETVGAKWKDKSTIRTYAVPSNPDTASQQKVRTVFGDMTKFLALFTDQIKYLSALDTAGMSVRNALIKLNKAQIEAGTFDQSALLVSKGGLQKPAGGTVAFATNKATFTWDPPTATNFSDKAKAIMIVVNPEENAAYVSDALASAGTGEVNAPVADNTKNVYYLYFLDYRGSSRVGSVSVNLVAS